MNLKIKGAVLLSVVLVAACAMLLAAPVLALNGDCDQTKDQLKDQIKDQTKDQLRDQTCADCLQDQTRLRIRDCF
jgi:hypothetical protein